MTTPGIALVAMVDAGRPSGFAVGDVGLLCRDELPIGRVLSTCRPAQPAASGGGVQHDEVAAHSVCARITFLACVR
jgi:hypothetical protein